MKKVHRLLLILSLSAASAHAAYKTFEYKIKDGDSLFEIAQKNHVSVGELQKLNDLDEDERLAIGEILKIPVGVVKHSYTIKEGDSLSMVAARHQLGMDTILTLNAIQQDAILKIGKKITLPGAAYPEYTVQSGDSLSLIAHRHHVSLDELITLNALKKSTILKIGSVLKLPRTAKMTRKIASATTHRVKRGDTLSELAEAHGTTTLALRMLNGIHSGEVLRIGRILKIPAAGYRVTEVDKKRFARVSKQVNTAKHVATQKGLPKDEIAKCIRITKIAKTKLGKRYVWGASGTKNTYDCSSFTKFVYRKNGINIPRTSIRQSKYGKFVKRKNLRKGDLIFFDTSRRRRGFVNHVGIYIGDNKFIHASSAKKKVVITSLDKKFYSQRYKGARRPS